MIVFGIGAFVHFSGPPRSLGWLLVVLLAAWIGQQIGGRLVSDTLGAFFGALIATPVAAWVATRPSGPPALASFLPAFWLLVPGAVGLIGMAEFVGSNRAAGLDHFVNSLITFISIGSACWSATRSCCAGPTAERVRGARRACRWRCRLPCRRARSAISSSV